MDKWKERSAISYQDLKTATTVTKMLFIVCCFQLEETLMPHIFTIFIQNENNLETKLHDSTRNHGSYVEQNDLKIYIITLSSTLSCFGNSGHKMSFCRWLNYTAASSQRDASIMLIMLITFQNRRDITIHTSIATSDKNHPRSYVSTLNELETLGFLDPSEVLAQNT